MKINCISCKGELNLDHKVFEDYEGPVERFSCGAMLEIQTLKGAFVSINQLSPLPQCSTDKISPNHSQQSIQQD